jgi:hypothetical protein
LVFYCVCTPHFTQDCYVDLEPEKPWHIPKLEIRYISRKADSVVWGEKGEAPHQLLLI